MSFATPSVVSTNVWVENSAPLGSLSSLKRACERSGRTKLQSSLFAGRTRGPFGINPLQIIDELSLVAAVGGEGGGTARVKLPDLYIEGPGIDDHSNTDVRDPASGVVSTTSNQLDALRINLTLRQVDHDLDFLRDRIAIPAEFARKDSRERCFESGGLICRDAAGKDHPRGHEYDRSQILEHDPKPPARSHDLLPLASRARGRIGGRTVKQ